MLLLPLASAISSPTESIIYEPDLEGLEIVLILDEGIWTQEAWSDLENHGLSPLRALSERAVLVWSEGYVFPAGGVEIQDRKSVV